MNQSSERERRTYDWIRILSEMPERFAGTAGEREAAARLNGWMRGMGVPSVSTESIPGRPQAGLVLALHTSLAALGCLWSGLLGAIIAWTAVWSFRREARQRQPALSRLLPAPQSVNVVGRLGASAPARRVVLSAHIDTAQAGVIFRSELADLFAHLAPRRSGPPAGPLALPELLIMVAAVLATAGWLGAHGAVFGILRGVDVVLLFVAIAAGLQWAGARETPGANDNASAVAAMLLCAEGLREKLPADVELWLVGTGAEEVGCQGMRELVAAHRDWPADSTYFVNFECVGGGALHYILTEGMLGKVVYPSMMNDLARRIAAGGELGEVTPIDLLAGTDGHVPAEHGYPTLSLISLEWNGVPRNYHRLEDTADGIDTAMVVRAADFGAAVALAALGGEAGPIGGPEKVSGAA